MAKLDILVKQFNKDYNEDIAVRGIPKIQVAKIPFSSPRANYMLYGGIPRGRLVEFAGEENGGKTTSALDVVANAQRLFRQEWEAEIEALQTKDKRNKTEDARLAYLISSGPKQIVYADCENTLDLEWAQKLGVDVEKVYLLKPQTQTAEQIFQMLLDMLETGEVGLTVIDSLGVMLSAAAYEKTMEEKTYGGIAMALTLFSKKAELLCAKHNTTLIGINQMREDLNSQYGGLTTTGGKAWKHNCSLRLLFQKGSYIDERGSEIKRSSESPSGNLVMMSIAKTKVCRPDRRTGFYTLRYSSGIDHIADAVEVALKYGMVVQSGAWFTLIDWETGVVMTDETDEEIKFQGKANLIEFLQDNDMIYQDLWANLKDKIEG